MWNGGGHHSSSHHASTTDENTRRLSIELAIAQHTGNPAPYGYDYGGGQSSYRSQMHMGGRPPIMHNGGGGGGWDHHDPHQAHRQHQQHHRQHQHHGAEDDDDDDDDDDEEEDYHRRQHHEQRQHSDQEEDDDDDDDDDDEEEEAEVAPSSPPPPKARGKPEAMAAKLASAAALAEKLDRQAEKEEAELVAKPVEEEDSMAVDEADVEAAAVATETITPAKPSSPKKKKKKTSPTPKKKKGSSHSTNLPTMEDPVKPITAVEYENLEALMVQFCRVPLLAEFSRPVSLLHPEVSVRNPSFLYFYWFFLSSPYLMSFFSFVLFFFSSRSTVDGDLFQGCGTPGRSRKSLPEDSSSTIPELARRAFGRLENFCELCQVSFTSQQQGSCPVLCIHCPTSQRLFQRFVARAHDAIRSSFTFG